MFPTVSMSYAGRWLPQKVVEPIAAAFSAAASSASMRSAHDPAPGRVCGAKALGDASPPAPGVPRAPCWLHKKPSASAATDVARAAATLAELRRRAAAARRWRRLAVVGTVVATDTDITAGGRKGQLAPPSFCRAPSHTRSGAGGSGGACATTSLTPRWGGQDRPLVPEDAQGVRPRASKVHILVDAPLSIVSVRPGMSEKGLSPFESQHPPRVLRVHDVCKRCQGSSPVTSGRPGHGRGDCGLAKVASPRAGAQ